VVVRGGNTLKGHTTNFLRISVVELEAVMGWTGGETDRQTDGHTGS